MLSTRKSNKFKAPSQNKSAADSWTILKNGIVQIFRKSQSTLSFEELYRNGYQLVVAKKGEEAYRNTKELIAEELKTQMLSLGSKHQHEQYLLNFKLMFDSHIIVIKMIRDILMYLDRTILKQKNLPLCYDMGVNVFRDTVYASISKSLFECLKTMFLQLRRQEFVDKRLIKDIIAIFIAIPKDTKARSETLYSADWEAYFLEESRLFYEQLSVEKIGKLDAVNYLQFCKQTLDQESAMVPELGLLPQTKPKLIQLIENELLHVHLQAILSNPISGITKLIDQNSISNVELMYKLLGRVPTGHPHLIQEVASHLKILGKSIIQNDQDEKQFYLIWIEKILALKAQFDGLLNTCFENNKIFEAQINMALQDVVNAVKNAPEYCSLYVDTNFKKLAKGGSDVDTDKVNRDVISVFRYLSEKDLFEKYYKGHLAKRLIYSKGVAEDAEKSMLAQLKIECGTQFTSKLEGMFTDAQLSGELTSSFRQHIKSKLEASGDSNPKLSVDVSLNILTSTNWPYTSKASGCNLPPALNSIISQFESFYLAKHSSRKLTWLKSHGTADVITRLPLFKKDKEINMSTYAMTLLVTCFNSANNELLEFKTLVEKTDIPLKELKRALQTLSLGKHKLLTKSTKGKEILETDTFKVNFDFNTTQTKFKILNIASKEDAKTETEKEREETITEIENTRKYQIEATLVRIMKSRQVMAHNLLVSTLIEQLSSRFTPNVTMVKERIEDLIERDFLERDPVER